MNFKQELTRENSLEEKHILPQKQFEKWNLKTCERNSCPSTPWWMKEGRQSCWKGGSLAGGMGGPGFWCCQLATSSQPSLPYLTPISSCSPREPWERRQEFGGKASMTAWMEKRGGIWQGSVFLHTKQCCLYSIPPHLCFTNAGLGTFQAPWTPGRGWCNLWTKPQ